VSFLRFIAALAALLAVLLGFDYLQYRKASKAREILSILDAFIHGVVAVIIVSPLLGIPGINKILILTVSFFDIDHFIVAKSMRISDAIKLNLRPYTHSITFALVLGFMTWGISQQAFLGIVVFIAVTSHVIRDAADGITPFLWPLPVRKIPYWLYLTVEILLFVSLQGLSSRW
jgi:membrane-bound metal-dependent hydrolase YbcI (DUF457 family)